MSQMSGMAPEGGAASEKPANTGRAVLLLSIAIILMVALLHELDNGSQRTALASKPSGDQATQPAVTNPTPTTSPLRSPPDVKVLVANGVGVAGAASKVASRLQPIGYQLAKPGNTMNKETVSSVQYAAGYQAEALALATSLGLPSSAVQALPTPAPVQDMQASSIVVVVGNDLAATGTANGATAQSPTANNTNPLTSGPLTSTPNAGTGTGTQSGTGAQSGTGLQSGTGTQSGTGAQSGTGLQSGTGTNSGATGTATN
jgi:hypothetical protein